MNQNTFAKIQKPTTDERILWDLISGHISFKTLLVAYNLNFFSIFVEKPLTVPEVCQILKIEHRAANALLSMCLATGLLQIKNNYYSLTQFSQNYLVESSPNYLGNFLNFLSANENIYSWQNLKNAVLTNSAQIYAGNDLFQTHQEKVDLARAFTYAIHDRNLAPAQAWADNLDLSKNKVLLDIGGGSGIYAINAVMRWPNLEAIIIDLASVCNLAKEFVSKYGLQERIKTEICDIWNQPFPKADIHFYSDIFHDWSLEKCFLLAQKSFNNLESGGRIIIHEMLYNEQKNGPLSVAASNMIMLLWTEGQQYSGHELTTLLKKVGFENVEVKPTCGYWSIITACKP
ncbi:methyltransferase [Gloeothece verrucosa]|uniref:O-methyltransferase family 2 n=1 Tax=Gloeothece verrucosa (strain PCC 7822) TaxID=497965 RepID=E0ULM5_GLOV7|nr:methyltransferase [Gloeothece verrucosa]ADN17855.1 O-methyltransferase family 2 [Gloeothece verrucosa PCC 7822]